MKKRLLSLVLILCMAVITFAFPTTTNANPDWLIPGRIMVFFETEPEIVEDGDYLIVEGITCSSVEPLFPSEDPHLAYLLILPEGANSQTDTEAAMELLLANPNVEYVEQDAEAFFDDPFIIGDVNADEEINITDYTIAKRMVMGTYVASYSAAADVNGDGVVKANDYILIKRHVMQTYVIG